MKNIALITIRKGLENTSRVLAAMLEAQGFVVEYFNYKIRPNTQKASINKTGGSFNSRQEFLTKGQAFL